MVKSQKDFVALVDLPVGEHQFKYFVDQQWTHDQALPTAANEVPKNRKLKAEFVSRLTPLVI